MRRKEFSTPRVTLWFLISVEVKALRETNHSKEEFIPIEMGGGTPRLQSAKRAEPGDAKPSGKRAPSHTFLFFSTI